MGLFRISLALLIVIGHYKMFGKQPGLSEYFPFLHGGHLHGGIKVQVFFIIAGFYTALLIKEKHPDGSLFPFYLNRLTRLLPCYYICLVAVVLLKYLQGKISLPSFDAKDIPAYIQIAHHIFVINPEIWSINHFHPSAITSHFKIGQAWSLSVDLALLLIVPIFLKTRARLIFIFIVALATSYYYATHGILRSYVGATMIFFVSGCLGYYVYDRYWRELYKGKLHVIGGYAMVAALCIIIYYFKLLERQFSLRGAYYIFIVLAVFSVPYIAATTRKIKIDRLVGEFAYPLYLNHLIVANFFIMILGHRPPHFSIIAVSLTISIMMYYLIDRPIGSFRRKKFQPPPPRAFI